MINALGRDGLAKPYQGVRQLPQRSYQKLAEVKHRQPIFGKTLEQILEALELHDGATLSFHHHLRNGDYVMQLVMDIVSKMSLKNLRIAASSIFPCHAFLVELMRQGGVTDLHCDYMSGPVAKAVSEGELQGECVITTHGGRPRAILEQELVIDVAFLATPCVDWTGAGTGSKGKSACGVLGYAIADAQMAHNVVLVTDHVLGNHETIEKPEIKASWVDYVLEVEAIGDPSGIVSGTTQITKDPVGLRIAADTAELLEHVGLLEDGFSFQTGAGGISLAVSEEVAKIMRRKGVVGSFASGGITDNLVRMHEEGLFEALYDVQCFTLGAVASIERNPHHYKMSASEYANPQQLQNITECLDIVILGVSEIDLDFNVNVTTGSDGYILGGSGGHADTAAGAKFAVVVSKLVSSRRSVVRRQVKTITTPGATIDALVTDRGIAINPIHTELIAQLKQNTKLNLVSMTELLQCAEALTGVPAEQKHSDKVVAISEYRDGTILDVIYQVDATKTGGEYEF